MFDHYFVPISKFYFVMFMLQFLYIFLKFKYVFNGSLYFFKGSFFCGQPCFQGNWDLHKALHKLARGNTPSSCSKPNKSYNPWPGYVFSGKLRPAEQSSKRFVPDHIPRPDYADHPEGYPISEQKLKGNTYVKQLDDEEIESLRVACKLGREVLDEGFKAVAVGVTTDEIDRVVHEASVDRNCYPSPLNYYQFPKSCCTSVNEVICHGIPDKRPLQVSFYNLSKNFIFLTFFDN